MKRRITVVLMLWGVLIGRLVEENRIDLSFFLSPYNSYIVIVPDGKGNLFITQRDRQEFIKLKENGKFGGTAPLLREGLIKSIDVTEEGEVVVTFVRTPGLIKAGKFQWAIIFYDGETLKKKGEFPFQQIAHRFEKIKEVRVLRSSRKLLIKGKMKGSNAILHVVDFNGRLLHSFCQCDTLIVDPFEREADCFSEKHLLIDDEDHLIYQIFPISGVVEVYSYEGKHIGGGSINCVNYSGIQAFKGKLLLLPFDEKANGRILEVMKLSKNRLKFINEQIELPFSAVNLVAKDSRRNKLYFLTGTSGSLLVICKFE